MFKPAAWSSGHNRAFTSSPPNSRSQERLWRHTSKWPGIGKPYEGVKELPSTDDWCCAVKRHLLSR